MKMSMMPAAMEKRPRTMKKVVNRLPNSSASSMVSALMGSTVTAVSMPRAALPSLLWRKGSRREMAASEFR